MGAASGNVSGMQNATSFSTPSVGLAGYDTCYSSATCYFNYYAFTEHYKIHRQSHTPTFTFTECSTACSADAACEAFEHLASPHEPACSFWMKGACNIGAGSPPGYATVSYAFFCDKTGARSAFTPMISSSKNSRIFGVVSVLSAFLIAMTG